MIFLASCKSRNVACLQLIWVERSEADKSIVVLVIFILCWQVTKSVGEPGLVILNENQPFEVQLHTDYSDFH